MDTFDRKKFETQYSNHLQRDIEKYQKNPFVSIEEEYERIAKKRDIAHAKRRDIPNSMDISQPDHVEYVEKFQNILNSPDSAELKDLAVLSHLAQHNETAKKELKTLQEGLHLSHTISQHFDKGATGNTVTAQKFDTYQKVQRMVDKVIFTTVQDLENDLTLISSRQKQSRVINRLSNVKLPTVSSANSSRAVKLPKLKGDSVVRALNAKISQDETDREPRYQREMLSMIEEEPKPRALAGFYVKEKKQKLNSDRDKESMRKDYMETFLKADAKVKNLSKQYLFNLTQHNNQSQDGSTSRVLADGDVSVCGNTTTRSGAQKSFPVLVNNTVELNEFLPPRNSSIGAGNNTYLSNLLGEQSTMIRRVDMGTKDRRKASGSQTDRQSSISKKGFMNGKRPGEKGKPHWLETEKQVEKRKNQFMYEGMGLLTLHNGKDLPVNSPTAFSVDYFNLHIEKMNRKDLDYIKKTTGVNLKHSLYDRVLNERDILRFGPSDLGLL